jgi:2-polyprenyl-3-methyl-5-hydroxy-6-metoxy-1,4-benzoquinol methylase
MARLDQKNNNTMGREEDFFGRIASEYHYSFRDNISASLARTRIHEILNKYISKKNGKVLDIGCGTGIDAQFLASLGVDVYAVDSSEGMLYEAANQLLNTKEEIRNKIELRRMTISPDNIANLISNVKANQLVLSFGVINFIQDIDSLFFSIGSSLEDGGICIVTSLTKSSLWDRILKIGYKRAGKQPKNVFIGGVSVKVWFWDCRDILIASKRFFDPIDIIGIGYIYPPPYLDKYIRQHPKVQEMLWKVDRKYESTRFAFKFADHIAIVLKRCNK